MDHEAHLEINETTSKDSSKQGNEILESKKRKVTENAIERRLRGPTIKTYLSDPNKDIHFSHPLVLDMPELLSIFPSQKDLNKKTTSTSSKEAWKHKLGKFAFATPESEPDYMWLPFFSTLFQFFYFLIFIKYIAISKLYVP